ncbi:lytic transglycosylase domain-containing protein [Stutzerimonas stutzeri]|uniref:lytic transglycosylase domain-containing protein n=1 Tax=Stutzerimonas stutzeri TaxID=316 RepID=UPI0015E3C462|nr:lytic transglycosylase domain-containing protein [Stutzerimonas stutzeri]MBA1280418.1 lytic transglycosylase domain-containing protein [Stutzerimonas stutzeri]
MKKRPHPKTTATVRFMVKPKFLRTFVSACVAICAVQSVPASAGAQVDGYRPLTSDCLATVAERYEIHVDVLFALLMVEGGTVGRNSRTNGNGSYDIGPFQLNNIHLPALAALGVSEEELRNDGCLNAAVAGWHLRRVMTPKVMAGITDEQSYLQALALYHSATPEHNEVYANKLRGAFAYIYQQGR